MPASTEVDALLLVMPRWIVSHIEAVGEIVEEIELDLGRPPRLRLRDRISAVTLPGEVGREDLQYILGRVTRFREDNRTGIERTLHRIACIRDRYHEIIGFTFRAGRAMPDAARPLRDLLATGGNVLVVGRPGVGKTTVLRSAAAILSEELNRRVVIADTSNEIGGDGQVPHPAIGSARRLQIPLADPDRPSGAGDRQAGVIFQAVINHRAETIIVDELGFAADARTARTIARRGIQLVATAHGGSLSDVVFNPELAGLLGDTHPVVLSSDELQRRGGLRHTILERTGPPVFDWVVEIARRDLFLVHHDVAASVDCILGGLSPKVLVRRGDRAEDERREEPHPAAPNPNGGEAQEPGQANRGAGCREVV